MSFTIAISPHGHSQKNTANVMRLTILALVPGILAQWYIFGWGVVVQLCIAMFSAIVAEAAILKLRGFAVMRHLADSSALLTAALVAVAIPPFLPWWMTVVAVVFAIIVAKQLYGGLGQNIFNPAMVAYVFLLVSFPASMTSWQAPEVARHATLNLIETAEVIFQGHSHTSMTTAHLAQLVDGSTMATPLDHLKTSLKQGQSLDSIVSSHAFSVSSEQGWKWINISFIAGGVILFIFRLIPWRTPFAMIGTLALCSWIGHQIDPTQFVSPAIELLSGATMLGAFFIVTDPVTGSTTNRGRLIFGAIIGLLIFIIRHFGGYPDGVAFSVLLTNILVPFIDKFSQSRVYGY